MNMHYFELNPYSRYPWMSTRHHLGVLNIAGSDLTWGWEILPKSYILVYLVTHVNVFSINIIKAWCHSHLNRYS